MFNIKLIAVLALVAITSSSVNCQRRPVIKPVTDADWEVLLAAINNPNSVTLPVLQHAIFRILASFVPPFSPRPGPRPAPAPPSPVADPPAPAPVPAPAPIPIIIPSSPSPPSRMPSISPELLLHMISSHPNFYQALQNDPVSLGAIARILHPGSPRTISRPSPAVISAPPHIHISHNHGDDCGCKKKGHKSLADFMVNVPCPKTTEKPPRKVVVKVPCPTTEKPCTCQCCPCNPCKKKSKKESCSSESKESIEVKTYVHKKHNEVRHPHHIHRVHVNSKSSEETKSRPVKKHNYWHAHKVAAHQKHSKSNSDSNE